MKSFPNQTTEVKDGEKNFKYSDLLKIVLMVHPQGGYSIADMKTRLKLTEVLENADGEISFEDADYNYLKPLVNAMKWNGIHKDLISLTDDFNNAK